MIRSFEKGSPYGTFSLKSAYNIVCDLEMVLKVRLFKLVHHWEGPERFQNFLWKINHETMLINVRRKHFGISENDSCQLC